MRAPRRWAIRVLVVVLILFVVPPASPDEDGDDGWAFIQALAALDASGPYPLADGVNDAWQLIASDATPASIRDFVAARVQLVPYEGSYCEPHCVRRGSRLNSLDRARYLSAILRIGGRETRVVSVPRGDGASLSYPATTPPVPVRVNAKVQDAIRAQTATLTPKLLAAAQRAAPSWVGAGAQAPEADVFWVQVEEQGTWNDLLFDDTHLSDALRAKGHPLTSPALDERTWYVGIDAFVRRGDVEEQIFGFESPASDYHCRAVTYLHRPEGSLSTFSPVLVFGSDLLEGRPFQIGGDAGAIDSSWIRVTMRGPGESRSFTRRLVGPPAAGVTAGERGFELAVVAKVTVATTRITDADTASLIEGNFARVARELFQGGRQREDVRPLALTSLRSVALLDASDQLMGNAGDAAKGVLVYRRRPAVVLEHTSMRLDGDTLRRVQVTDLLDAGTAVHAPAASREAVAAAAIEQSVIDAHLEDWLAIGDGLSTAYDHVEARVLAGAAFDSASPPTTSGRETFEGASVTYATTAEDDGTRVGLRLTSGPSAVWVLGTRAGGAVATSRPIDRVRDLCEPLQWGVYLVPLRVMPYSWLAGPLVAYYCRLSEAYNKAASALERAMGGGGPSVDDRIRDLENQLLGLGPALVTDLAVSAGVNALVHGVLGPAAGAFAREALGPLLRYLNRAGGRLIPRAGGRAGGRALEEVVESELRASTEAAAQTAARLRGEELSAEETRRLLRNSTREAAEEAADRLAAGEADEIVMRDVSEAELQRMQRAGRALSKALDEAYQGRPMPKMHVTDRDALAGIQRSGRLENAETKPNFSQGGAVGADRRGGVAIRVRPELSRAHYDYVSSPEGELARYWPDGVGNGRPLYDLPVDHLERFDVATGRWVPVRPLE